MATQICSVDVQFLQRDLLSIQIYADRFCHTRFRHIRWRQAHRTDESSVQIMEHMALYPSTRTLRLLRPWRICPSSTLIRRSFATPLIRLAFPFSLTSTSCTLTCCATERGD